MRSAILASVFCVTVAMSQVAGGKTPQTASDPEHMDRVWGATKGVNEGSNAAGNHMIPIKVLSATSQVVAGASYDYEVLFGESTCEKGHVSAAELTKSNCALKENGNRAIYSVNVWEKPWENFQQFDVKKVRDVAAHEQF